LKNNFITNEYLKSILEMTHPYGFSIEALEAISQDLEGCIKDIVEKIDENSFLKGFSDGKDFVFELRKFLLLNDKVLTDYLYYVIPFEYGEFLSDSKGRELTYEDCKKLIWWMLGDKIEGWKSATTISKSILLQDSIYHIFVAHFRNRFHPGIKIKVKIQKAGSAYEILAGFQYSASIPIDLTVDSVKNSINWKKFEQNQEILAKDKAIQLDSFLLRMKQKRIQRSASLCKKFLLVASKKYKKNTSKIEQIFDSELGLMFDNLFKEKIWRHSHRESQGLIERIKHNILRIL